MKTFYISAICSMITSLVSAMPTPIPAPNQTYAEASESVLKKYEKPSGKGGTKWCSNPFPQFVTYTTYKYSTTLKERFASEKKLKNSEYSFLITEFGWLVTVVFGHDLSLSHTYFVRPSGEIVLLWVTN